MGRQTVFLVSLGSSPTDTTVVSSLPVYSFSSPHSNLLHWEQKKCPWRKTPLSFQGAVECLANKSVASRPPLASLYWTNWSYVHMYMYNSISVLSRQIPLALALMLESFLAVWPGKTSSTSLNLHVHLKNGLIFTWWGYLWSTLPTQGRLSVSSNFCGLINKLDTLSGTFLTACPAQTLPCVL